MKRPPKHFFEPFWRIEIHFDVVAMRAFTRDPPLLFFSRKHPPKVGSHHEWDVIISQTSKYTTIMEGTQQRCRAGSGKSDDVNRSAARLGASAFNKQRAFNIKKQLI